MPTEASAQTIPDRGWWRLGRWSARAHGTFLLLSVAVLAFVVGPAPAPDNGDVAAALASHEATWPWAAMGLAFLAVGFLALAPLGLALRSLYGKGDVVWDLIALLFAMAAVLEATSLILQIASKTAVWHMGPDEPTETVSQLLVLDQVAGVAGLLFAFFTFLMVAAAMALIGRWTLTKGLLPRPLGWLAAAIAVAYVLGQVGIAAGQVGVGMVGRLLAMGVLTPVWAFWFAHHLHAKRTP